MILLEYAGINPKDINLQTHIKAKNAWALQIWNFKRHTYIHLFLKFRRILQNIIKDNMSFYLRFYLS
jgi:hypothetical protein